MTVTLDINQFINQYNEFIFELNEPVKFTGKRDEIYIKQKYNQLDLSEVECTILCYRNQKGDDIKNHILPNSLKKLYCCINNGLTKLPNLPSSLAILDCSNNQLMSLTNLPSSLAILDCRNNQLTSLSNLPNSLKNLNCSNNQLTELPNLHNSLDILYYYGNKLTELPENFKIDNLKFFNIEIIRYGIISNKSHYSDYNIWISKKYNEDNLIKELISKLDKNDIKKLYELYLNLGNESNENIKIENDKIWVTIDNPFDMLLRDLIKCESVKYSLIHVYKINKRFFN